MLNQELAIGFDTMGAGDSINNQIYPFKVTSPDAATIVAGRGSGQALQMTPGATLQYLPDDNRVGPWGVSVGCAIKYTQLAPADEALICGAFYTDTAITFTELLATEDYTALIIKSGSVWLYEKHQGVLKTTDITSFSPANWLYFEFRTTTNATTSTSYWTRVYLHGVQLLGFSSKARSNMPLRVVYAATQSGAIMIDDVYTHVQVSTANHVVLASAKVKCLPLTEVLETSWSVEGAEPEHTALNDLNDSTGIQSANAAKGKYRISNDVQSVHLVNYHIRARSDNSSGVMQINAGKVGSSNESALTTIGATAELRTNIIRGVAHPQYSWERDLNDGASLILRT
ncbi:hypothetical protein [Shewanella sp. MTB7]|uniref:hypothetical protein n=2 Tax=Shewanella TaxID=22 RepID=UPI0022BA5EF4|nr:hypothetical protein [Shewanella sp. MTB7]WBJ95335.1 hypothetical protein HWQ47_26700 [Shewanella sp. MTB7]